MPGFGHVGLGGSLGWADPGSGLSFGFVHNRLLTPFVVADQAGFVATAALDPSRRRRRAQARLPAGAGVRRAVRLRASARRRIVAATPTCCDSNDVCTGRQLFCAFLRRGSVKALTLTSSRDERGTGSGVDPTALITIRRHASRCLVATAFATGLGLGPTALAFAIHPMTGDGTSICTTSASRITPQKQRTAV